MDFRLIFVPFGHYDEPEILPYENASACPIGADVGHLPPDSFLIADKAYDAKWIRDVIEQRDAVAIIPDREGAKTRHAFSNPLY